MFGLVVWFCWLIGQVWFGRVCLIGLGWYLQFDSFLLEDDDDDGDGILDIDEDDDGDGVRNEDDPDDDGDGIPDEDDEL